MTSPVESEDSSDTGGAGVEWVGVEGAGVEEVEVEGAGVDGASGKVDTEWVRVEEVVLSSSCLSGG